MTVLRLKLIFAVGVLIAGLSAAVLEVTPAYAAKPPVFTGLVKGVGAGGYDVVAYFTQNKPVRGSASFTHKHSGAVWRFASEENRDLFAANPQKYAPQYGGYCAFAVSRGYTAKGDPHAWTVHGGKLYLNYNKKVRATWASDIPGNVSKGDKNWPGVLKNNWRMPSVNSGDRDFLRPHHPVNLGDEVFNFSNWVRSGSRAFTGKVHERPI